MSEIVLPGDGGEGPGPGLLRGAMERRYSRRDMLRMAGAGGAALGAGALLAACGVSGTKAPVSSSKSAVEQYWAGKKQTPQVNWAQWPLYIDVSSTNKSDHPSIDMFEKKTGVKVDYFEVIQDDGPFFAKVQPSLSAGQYSGYDVATITNGVYLTKFQELGFLVPLDHSYLTNFAKYAGAKYKDESYDPGNKFSVPWQSGFTGIGYNPKYTGREINSFFDLFDPKFKGKVGMFADNEDLPNAMLVAMGYDPAKTGPTQWRKAAAKLEQQKKAGIVRQYGHQGYINSLTKGDLWISQAWSGDIFQANASGGSLKFVIPKEGGVIWTDNLVILKGTKNPVSAIELMDWYFRPDIAAMVAEGVNYITPVPGAKTYVQQDASRASGSNKASLQYIANSPLVFPTKAEYAQTYRYRILTNKELQVWDSIFEPIYLG
ncbi:MAG: polyamine ABC transporter substrate-binding protein [Acidimicrobiales bacterium]